jgi:ribonuclease I
MVLLVCLSWKPGFCMHSMAKEQDGRGRQEERRRGAGRRRAGLKKRV